MRTHDPRKLVVMEVVFVTLGVAYQMSMHSSQHTFWQTTAFLPVRAGTSCGALEFAAEPTKFRGLEPGTSTRGDDACSLPTLFTVQISKRTNPKRRTSPVAVSRQNSLCFAAPSFFWRTRWTVRRLMCVRPPPTHALYL